MPETVQELLTSFDALPDADKHQVAVEILRRVPLSEERLDERVIKPPPPIRDSRLGLRRSLPIVWMLSLAALLAEGGGIGCLVVLWLSVFEMIPTGRLITSHEVTAISICYLLAWGCFTIAFVFAVLGQSLAPRNRWFSKVLLIVTIEFPLAGYTLLFSLMKWAM